MAASGVLAAEKEGRPSPREKRAVSVLLDAVCMRTFVWEELSGVADRVLPTPRAKEARPLPPSYTAALAGT